MRDLVTRPRRVGSARSIREPACVQVSSSEHGVVAPRAASICAARAFANNYFSSCAHEDAARRHEHEDLLTWSGIQHGRERDRAHASGGAVAPAVIVWS